MILRLVFSPDFDWKYGYSGQTGREKHGLKRSQ